MRGSVDIEEHDPYEKEEIEYLRELNADKPALFELMVAIDARDGSELIPQGHWGSIPRVGDILSIGKPDTFTVVAVKHVYTEDRSVANGVLHTIWIAALPVEGDEDAINWGNGV